jgi:hypothetical protein
MVRAVLGGWIGDPDASFFILYFCSDFFETTVGSEKPHFREKSGAGSSLTHIDLFAPDFCQQDLLAAIIRNRLAT